MTTGRHAPPSGSAGEGHAVKVPNVRDQVPALHGVAAAAEALAAVLAQPASALLITAGAGMSADSGLQTFRGPDGMWSSAVAGTVLSVVANPSTFDTDPKLAWGFYGARLNAYRSAVPHAGYDVLRSWANATTHGAAVFTSNVDSAFAAGNFPAKALCERHGSMAWLQCTSPRLCDQSDLWSSDPVKLTVSERLRATGPLPTCACDRVARPNVLMFGDAHFVPRRAAEQYDALLSWLRTVEGSGAALAVVELGAGTTISTVRMFGERIASELNAPLIRVNLDETQAQGPSGCFSVVGGAQAALLAMEAARTSI